MNGVISAVIRFREWAVLHGDMWGGLADSYHSQDILCQDS